MRATQVAECEGCGRSYQALVYNVRRGRARYCGKSCHSRANLTGLARLGPANPNWRGGVSKFPARYTKAYKARNPERVRAHALLGAAVKAGRVQRPSACSSCGNVTRVDAHHHDYSQPLSVEWLCRLCHVARHRPNHHPARDRMTCYTVRQVCQRLQMSRQTFYRQEATLRQRGVLVELLPRIGTARRFAVDPIERYLAGGFNAAEIRRGLRAAGEGR